MNPALDGGTGMVPQRGESINCTRTFPSQSTCACDITFSVQLSSATTPLLHSDLVTKAGCPYRCIETLFSNPALHQASSDTTSRYYSKLQLSQVDKLHLPHCELQKLLFQNYQA